MTGPEPKRVNGGANGGVNGVATGGGATAGKHELKARSEAGRELAPSEPTSREGLIPQTRTQEVRLRQVIDSERVQSRIEEIADALARDYQDRPLVMLVIAEGARRFGDALLDGLEERLVFPELVFVRARRTQGTTLGAVQVDAIDLRQFAGRDVLIVDDIADEGVTLEAIAGLVDEAEPSSLELAVLVNKLARRRIDLPLRYVGFEIEQGWVVGFGMDLDGRYRELDHIAIAEVPES